MNKKGFMLFSLLLAVVIMVSISSSFAVDLNDTDKISEESNDELVVDNDGHVSKDNYHSFTELQYLINNPDDDGNIYLEHDYAYDPDVDGDDLKDGLTFNSHSNNQDDDLGDDDDEDDDELDDDLSDDDEDDDYDYDDGDDTIKSHTIYGNNHIINGNGARIFNLAVNDYIFIENLTFINTGGDDTINGGAICNYGDLSLENCTFKNFHAYDGGAIYSKGIIYISNCTFDNNTAVNEGGAIYNSLNDNGEFYACDVLFSYFSNNKAKNGGAMYNAIASDCHFADNNIAENSGHNMYYGIKRECIEESSNNKNYYGTMDSSGFTFELNYFEIVSNTKILMDVLVTDNLTGEPVSGVCVNVDYVYKDYTTYSEVTDEDGIASFSIKWQYYTYEENNDWYDDDLDDDELDDDESGDDESGDDDEDLPDDEYDKMVEIYLNNELFNDDVLSYYVIDSDDLDCLSFNLNKVIMISNSEIYVEVVVTNNTNNAPAPYIYVDINLILWEDFDEWGMDYENIFKQVCTDENGIANVTIKCEDSEGYEVDKFASDMELSVSLSYSAYNDTTFSGPLGIMANINSSVVFNNDIVFDYGLTGSSSFTLNWADEIKVSVKNHPEAVLKIENNTLYVSGLNSGNYVLFAETVPDYYVTPYNTTLNIAVRKISKVSFTAGMVFEYGGSGVIHMIVEGGTVSKNNIQVVGHPEAVIKLSNNDITVSNLPVGSFTLRVVSTPEAGLAPAEGTVGITVKKSTAVIRASKITVAYKKGTKWTIKLVDSKTGKPIRNVKLTLKVYTGKKYKTVKINTNSKGEATYQTKKLSKGKHKVIVSAKHSGYNFNTLTSSIKVIKQTTLKFKVKKNTAKDGASLSIKVTKNKKPINGVRVKLLIYTGKKLAKTIILKTKTDGKEKGVVGYATNELSVGTHKVLIMPADIKYGGSAKSSMKITKKAKKYSKITTRISA